MTIWEIVIIGAALSMDAVAVGMTDGMTESGMPPYKPVMIAGAFALFQFLMPVLGYLFGSVFMGIVETIAPWLSFVLLAFIGGKMIFDCAKELREAKKGRAPLIKKTRGLTAGGLLMQAIATSIDAFAVGVTLLAAETARGLPLPFDHCSLVIGAVTFVLSLSAVLLGKKAGGLLSDKAELLGGSVLVVIGIKLLVEGLL